MGTKKIDRDRTTHESLIKNVHFQKMIGIMITFV